MTAAKGKKNPFKKVGSLVFGFDLQIYNFSLFENEVSLAYKAASDTALTPTPKMLAVRMTELRCNFFWWLNNLILFKQRWGADFAGTPS